MLCFFLLSWPALARLLNKNSTFFCLFHFSVFFSFLHFDIFCFYPPQDPLKYDHLLVARGNSTPYLSSNSQGAIAASADLAAAHGSSKLTFLLIDEPGRSSGDSAGADPSVRIKTVSWHLSERGCGVPFEMLERAIGEPGAASALVGDVADEVGADLLVMSSSGVHDKHVNANLLCEFVSCPVLLLP